MDTRAIRHKIYKAEPSSPSGMRIADRTQTIGGTFSRLTIDQDLGMLLRGPVGFTEGPGGVKFAGIFRLNPALSSCFPSTIASPLPVLQFEPPLVALGEIIQSCFDVLQSFTG